MGAAVLDFDHADIQTAYCISNELRDVQVAANLPRFPKRIQQGAATDERCAIVCYGPSLADTWEQVRDYPVIVSVSGAHRFLLERGIVPTYHVEVDPRLHKAELMGPPDTRVKYLMASCCHPVLMDSLQGHDVTLWHVYTGETDAKAKPIYPRGEWALTGGANVGLRALVIAHFLGHRTLGLFGMDYSFTWDGTDAGTNQQHAGAHPNETKANAIIEVGPHRFLSSSSMVTYCRQFFHEIAQLAGIDLTVTGWGLLQAKIAERMGSMAGTITTKPGPKVIAMATEETISAEYASLNRQLHAQRPDYGAHGSTHAETVRKMVTPDVESVLDYGCGKGTLARVLDFPIWEYDPAIPGKDMPPRAADLVVCTDVLEHIEPDKLRAVLRDLQRVTRKVGYFVVNTGPALKTLPDGRNTHLIQKPAEWWGRKLGAYFTVAKLVTKGTDVHVVVAPRAA